MSANVVRVNGDYKIVTQGGDITLDANGTSTGNITIKGNLNIQGNTTSITTTSITTTDVNINDNIITLNNGESNSHSGISLGSSGIKINRGSLTFAEILFDETIQWTNPYIGQTENGVFVFKTTDNKLRGIRTNSIGTGGENLNLIDNANGFVTVHGTTDYEQHIIDYSKITQIFNIGTIARNNNNIATISLSGTHGFDITGNKTVYVYIQCTTNSTFNAVNVRVLSTPTTSSFTYASAGTLLSNMPATGTVRPSIIKDDDAIPNMKAVADYTDNLKTFNKLIITAPANAATLTIADGKALTVNNTVTFTSTDLASVDFGSGGTVAYTNSGGSGDIIRSTDKISALASSTSSDLASLLTDETGTGNAVFNTSPTFITSITTSSTSFDLINSTATTVNFAGAGTAVSIGANTGTTTVNNKLAATSNVASPNFISGLTNTTSSAGTATLSATSNYYQNISGSSVHNYKLPDATTLTNGHTFVINNNNTSGNITVQYNDATSAGSVIPGANKIVTLYNNGTTNGSWDLHGLIPANASWGSSSLDTNATTFSALVAQTSLTFGYGGTSTATLNIATGATASGNTKTINLGTGAVSGSTTAINIGSANGGTITFNSQTKLGSTASGTAILTSDVTTGNINLFTSLTTGTLYIGSGADGKASVSFTSNSTSTTTGALVVAGGVGIAKNLYLGSTTTMKFQDVSSTPTADSSGVIIYTKAANLGNTGIYYVNSTTQGELVSKRKALAYSIVFG